MSMQPIPLPLPVIVPNSEICGVCEKPGAGAVRCIAECKKYYHKDCADKMAAKTVNNSAESYIEI